MFHLGHEKFLMTLNQNINITISNIIIKLIYIYIYISKLYKKC